MPCHEVPPRRPSRAAQMGDDTDDEAYQTTRCSASQGSTIMAAPACRTYSPTRTGRATTRRPCRTDWCVNCNSSCSMRDFAWVAVCQTMLSCGTIYPLRSGCLWSHDQRRGRAPPPRCGVVVGRMERIHKDRQHTDDHPRGHGPPSRGLRPRSRLRAQRHAPLPWCTVLGHHARQLTSIRTLLLQHFRVQNDCALHEERLDARVCLAENIRLYGDSGRKRLPRHTAGVLAVGKVTGL